MVACGSNRVQHFVVDDRLRYIEIINLFFRLVPWYHLQMMMRHPIFEYRQKHRLTQLVLAELWSVQRGWRMSRKQISNWE